MECKDNRKFDLNNVPDKLPEEAWATLKKVSDEKDLEEFREVRLWPRPISLPIRSADHTGPQNLLQGGSSGHFRGY